MGVFESIRAAIPGQDRDRDRDRPWRMAHRPIADREPLTGAAASSAASAAHEHAGQVLAELGRRVQIARRLGAVGGVLGGVGDGRAAGERLLDRRTARNGVLPMLTSATRVAAVRSRPRARRRSPSPGPGG